MPGAIFLEGDKINLRTLEKEDAEFLRDLNHSSEIRKYLGRHPKPNSLDDEEDRISSVNESEEIIQFIIARNSEAVGTIAIFDIDHVYSSAEVGAFMVHPEKHGDGIGTEAMELIIDYAFNQLNLHRIQGGYIEDNESSKAVQKKFGFEKEGKERDAVFRDGEYKHIIRMSLLEREWRSE